jgi:hypothetical protein
MKKVSPLVWFAGPIAAVVLACLGIDLTVWLSGGETFSAFMGEEGQAHPAVKAGWIGGGIALVIGLAFHFWWGGQVPNKGD